MEVESADDKEDEAEAAVCWSEEEEAEEAIVECCGELSVAGKAKLRTGSR